MRSGSLGAVCIDAEPDAPSAAMRVMATANRLGYPRLRMRSIVVQAPRQCVVDLRSSNVANEQKVKPQVAELDAGFRSALSTMRI
jgi:hypothetical protein